MNSDTVIAHELTHSLDMWRARAQGLDRLSLGTDWFQAVEQDVAVASEYSTSNYIEAFAEIGILHAYDVGSNGGLSGVEPRWRDVESQLNFISSRSGDDLNPAATGCPAKVPSTELTSKSNLLRQRFQAPRGVERFTPTKGYPVRDD